MQKGFIPILVLVGILLVAAVTVTAFYVRKPLTTAVPPPTQAPQTGTVCIQVITPAQNPKTSECKEFPTPCDVPAGWETVESCLAPPVQKVIPTPFPTILSGWKSHDFKSEGLTIYTPQDWESSIEYFPNIPSTLIRFWKKSSPNIVPIQLDIKANWDNTGDAQYQPQNYKVANTFTAYRVDPPQKSKMVLERYQTNIYFGTKGKVYVFQCVHNWQQDYLDTCNTMLETLKLD